MNRHQLEARVWLGLRDLGLDRKPNGAQVVRYILDAADQYAISTGGLINERRAETQLARQALAVASAQYQDTPQQRAARRRALARANAIHMSKGKAS